MRPLRTFSSSAATSLCACWTASGALLESSVTLRSNCCLTRGEARDFGLGFREFEIVGGEFVFGRGVLIDQAMQSVVSALKAVALCDGGGKCARGLRGIGR